MLKPDLQIALGLETVNPEVLMKLNKRMTLEDFKSSVSFLTSNGIPSRAFILLRPPFMSEEEGVYWAERSIDFAFEAGVECCTIIPVRAGNGAMDHLLEKGYLYSSRYPVPGNCPGIWNWTAGRTCFCRYLGFKPLLPLCILCLIRGSAG